MSIKNFIPTLWAEEYIRAAETAHKFVADCVRKYEGQLKKMGDEVVIPSLGDMTIRDINIKANGAVSIDQVPEKVRKILDCKLPDSGMSDRNIFENYALLAPHDEVKFVVSSRSDFDWAIGVIDRFELEKKTANLIFSPVWGKVEFEELAQWVIDSGCNIRMQLQMHKLIWGDRKGV